jgi:Helicase conserved C-terminal domain/SNF2-related domain
MTPSLPEKPIVRFLHSHLQQLAPLFSDAELTQHALVDALRDKFLEALYSQTMDTRFLPFLFLSCQAIPGLNVESLSLDLASRSSPFPTFMSTPPPYFDSALVPIYVSLDAEVVGSGYVFYFEESLSPLDVYNLLVHAYGHLALGHLRKGDVYSHYDVLSELRSANGPMRRWDRAVHEQQHLWISSLPQNTAIISEDIYIEWSIPGFVGAFERLQREEVDDQAQVIQAFAAHYGTQFLQVDFEIGRDAQLFPHQKRGAAELVVRLQKLGVALLADSVGLGKTRTVATVIKLLLQHGLIEQAAVLTPSKLEHNWLAELKQLKLTIGSPGDSRADVVIINKDKFKRMDATTARREVRGCKLLVVEEAHQDMRNVDNKFHRNMRDVAYDKYGLLVTATPWNNCRGDIFGILQPFAANTLGTERPAQAFSCFSKGLDVGQQEFEQDTKVFQQVYNRTTLQRTRRQLRESGDTSVFYATRRPYLVNVKYTPEQRKAFATLLDKIEELRLPHFDPIRYLTTADEREKGLSGIHRFVLLKRAESGMHAFALSLAALASKAQEAYEQLEKVNDTEASVASWLRHRYKLEEAVDVDEFDREAAAEVLPPLRGRQARTQQMIDLAERRGGLRALKVTLLDDCLQDTQIIQSIQREFQSLFITDPKLETVLQQVNASIRSGQKVLCISQFADTAYTVYQALLEHPLLREKGVGLVMGSAKDGNAPVQINGHAKSRDEVISRFAPNAWVNAEKKKGKKASRNDQLPTTIDILVGSDTLSVGQNLQDARVLLNLDLCWNPMMHEQRIGRIDRPRHSDDFAPLDIFYFLNLDLIESELRLRETIEKRLTATYRDTAFDDEILPGYFDMIEQFSRLRKEQAEDKIYVAEADAILEDIAERSATPPDVVVLDTELEREALFRLQEAARHLARDNEEPITDRQLVSIGRVPYYDWQGSPRSIVPEAALVAEVAFQPVDQRQRAVGQKTYRYYYVTMHEQEKGNIDTLQVIVESESLVPVVDALLSETSLITLKKRHIAYLQKMLLCLEENILQERDNQTAVLKRARRYRSESSNDFDDEVRSEKMVDTIERHEAYSVEVHLINLRLLV